MKKWLKVLIGTIGIILILLLAGLYYSISYIDTTPYFETKYYANTIKGLNSKISNRKITNGVLFTGFAKINITPQIVSGNEEPLKGKFKKIKLAGFGDGKIATGVHDSIYAKAVALQVERNTVVLVSADLLMTPPEVVKKVEEKLKNKSDIKREQIYFGATHTHSSIGNCVPGYIGEKFEGEYNQEIVNWLAEKFTAIILKSIDNLQPSKIANGYIHAPNLVSNRIIGDTGRLNDRLSILSIKQNNGKQAVVGVFAAHATIIGPWNDQFSGDYPGYFQRALESKDIDMAMFFAGTVGSHTNKGIGSRFEKSKFVGESLADSALNLLNRLEYSDKITLSPFTTEIDIPKLQIIYISDNLRLSPEIGYKLLPEIKKVYLQAFKMNNFIWITMPCELSGEYAIDLQNALDLKDFNSAITSFNGQYLGYIVPAKYYYFDTYESRLMGWFGPSMGDYLMELNYTIADSLTGVKL